MTEPRHSAPARSRPRVLDLALYLVAALVIYGIGYGVGHAGDRPTPARPAATQPTTLTDGDPVTAGDGRLYYFRGFHIPAQYGHAHPLVSDTRTGTPKIAPGLTVTALPPNEGN